jgi:hypothetical protein
MTMLKDRMMQDLKLAGHAHETQKTYVECIGLFAQFCWSFNSPFRGRPRSRRHELPAPACSSSAKRSELDGPDHAVTNCPRPLARCPRNAQS